MAEDQFARIPSPNPPTVCKRMEHREARARQFALSTRATQRPNFPQATAASEGTSFGFICITADSLLVTELAASNNVFSLRCA